jgi:hypothetical protein
VAVSLGLSAVWALCFLFFKVVPKSFRWLRTMELTMLVLEAWFIVGIVCIQAAAKVYDTDLQPTRPPPCECHPVDAVA